MELKLKKPIVFFDLETTGSDITHDRIVEISILKVYPDGTEERKTRRLNPTIPIPLESSLIHGVYDKDVKDEPTFKKIGKSLAKLFEGCDIGGYNSNKFDVPLLMEEFIRADINIDLSQSRFVDVQVIYHKMEGRSLSDAYRYFCGKELENAHTADADTSATYEIMKSMLDKYDGNENIVNDIDKLSEFSTREKFLDFAGKIASDEDGEPIINFGQYKGVKVEDVLRTNLGYIDWIIHGNFPNYTKKVLKNIIEAIGVK